MELNEELEAAISSSNALMSTSAVLRAGGLVRGLFVTIATSNRFRDLNRNLRGSNSLQETENRFWIYLDFLKTSYTRKDLP